MQFYYIYHVLSFHIHIANIQKIYIQSDGKYAVDFSILKYDMVQRRLEYMAKKAYET